MNIFSILKNMFFKKESSIQIVEEKENYEPVFKIIPENKINVYGFMITLIQEELKRKGAEIKVDGVLGKKTIQTIRKFVPGPDNIVTTKDLEFLKIENNDILRIINLTSAFENTGFSKVLAAFDSGIITFGLVGFTWGGGNLQSLMKEALLKYPDIFNESFKNARYEEWKKILYVGFSEQVKWAKSWSPNQYIMPEPTRSAFEKFGSYDEIKKLQISKAIDAYMKPALKWCNKYNLKEMITLALTYDVFVQMGSHDRKPPQNVLNQYNEFSYRKWAIEEAISQAAQRFKNNVKQRKTFFLDFSNTPRNIINDMEVLDTQNRITINREIVYGRNYDLICQGIFKRNYII